MNKNLIRQIKDTDSRNIRGRKNTLKRVLENIGSEGSECKVTPTEFDVDIENEEFALAFSESDAALIASTKPEVLTLNVESAKYTFYLLYQQDSDGEITLNYGMPQLIQGKYQLAVNLSASEGNYYIDGACTSVGGGEELFEAGTGENSIQQKGTGVQATGNNSIATGHGEIQKSDEIEDGFTLIWFESNTYNVVSSEGYPFRVGQILSTNSDGSDYRVIVSINTEQNEITLNDRFTSFSDTDQPVYIITGIAYGNNSYVEGNGCFSGNNSSHAEGTGASAYGKYSHAEGLETVAEGDKSHAEGQSTQAVGDKSHSEGHETITMGKSSHSEGYNTKTGGGDSTNTLTPDTDNLQGKKGYYAHAEGNASLARGACSHAEGQHTFAAGISSHTEGKDTVTNSEYSHAEGAGSIAGTGYDDGTVAHAEGESTQALAWASHAEGYQTKANAWVAHAEGAYTLAGTGSQPSAYESDANGRFAHAEGNGTWAKGSASHSEGRHTQALKKYDHAEGWGTTANGVAAHAEGEDTQANAECSHAEGWETRTTNDCEHAEGQFNASHTGDQDEEKTMHSVGIGSNNNNRINAIEIMKNGSIFIYGLGGYDGTNPMSATSLQDIINNI